MVSTLKDVRYGFKKFSEKRNTQKRTIINSKKDIAPYKAILIPKSGKFCLWNPGFWVLESVIQLQESGIPLTIGIRNPSSIDKDWKKQLQSRIQEPRLSWISFHGAKDTIGRLLEKFKRFRSFQYYQRVNPPIVTVICCP